MKYAVVKNKIVINMVEWDGEQAWEPEEGVAVIAEKNTEIGWSYDGKAFTPPAAPEKSKEELIAEAEQMKASMLSLADSVTADWRVELMLGDISADDKAKLSAWMAYKQAVKAVDTSTAPDISWPEQPDK